MAKTSSKPRNKTTATAPTKKTTTLSIRLTDKEKALIAKAAGLQNDRSPTAFIKSAALTKAAHVINTKTENSFDFNALGERLVTLLFDDFPKEFLVKLTESGKEELKRLQQQPNNLLPKDEVGVYSPVWAKEYQSHSNDDHYWTSGYEDYIGAKFESGNPLETDELRLWIPIDQIPESMKPEEPLGVGGLIEDVEDDPYVAHIPSTAPVVRDKRQKLTADEFDALRRAIHLGGSEFIETLIQTAMDKYPFADDIVIARPNPSTLTPCNPSLGQPTRTAQT